MTELIVKRTGKLLFPRLPHDMRRQQMSKLLFIVSATIACNTTLVYLMFHHWR